MAKRLDVFTMSTLTTFAWTCVKAEIYIVSAGIKVRVCTTSAQERRSNGGFRVDPPTQCASFPCQVSRLPGLVCELNLPCFRVKPACQVPSPSESIHSSS